MLTRLPDQLVGLISSDIRQGVFPVGSRLPPEPELCTHYGVSRTVLREALARLKADGLVDAQQGRGSFVMGHSLRTPFRFNPETAGSLQAIVQLAELRLGVEGTAAALAAARRTPAQLKRLKRCLSQMDAALRQGNGVGGEEADLEFHQTIAEATGNEHCQAFMAYLRQYYIAAIKAARARSAVRHGLSRQVQDEHVAIYEALAAGDPERAEFATKQHIRNAIARLSA